MYHIFLFSFVNWWTFRFYSISWLWGVQLSMTEWFHFLFGIAWSHGSSIFRILGTYLPFYRVTILICTPTNHVLGFPFLHVLASTCYHLITTSKTGVNRNLIVVFICISLMIGEVEFSHVFYSCSYVSFSFWKIITSSTLFLWIIYMLFMLLSFVFMVSGL